MTLDHIAVIGHQQGMHIEILSLVSPLEFRTPFSGQAALYRVLPHPNTSETPLFRCTEPTSTTMKSQKVANFQWTLPSDKMLRSCTYQFWSLCVAGGQQVATALCLWGHTSDPSELCIALASSFRPVSRKHLRKSQISALHRNCCCCPSVWCSTQLWTTNTRDVHCHKAHQDLSHRT